MTTSGPPLVEEGLGFDGFSLLSTGFKSNTGARRGAVISFAIEIYLDSLTPNARFDSLGVKPIRSP